MLVIHSMHPKESRMQLLPRQQHGQWVPVGAAALCGALSIVNFMALFAPSLHSRLARQLDVLPGVVGNAAVLATAIAGVLLWFIAGGLARRKRRAWLIAVLLLSLNLVVRAWAGVHAKGMAPMVVNAALLVFLLCFAGDFFARSEPISKRRALPNLIAVGWQFLVTVLLFPLCHELMDRFGDGDSRLR